METLKENQELLQTIDARQQMIKELFDEIKQEITYNKQDTKTIIEMWDECLDEHVLAV